jgi:hypothetical protein
MYQIKLLQQNHFTSKTSNSQRVTHFQNLQYIEITNILTPKKY